MPRERNDLLLQITVIIVVMFLVILPTRLDLTRMLFGILYYSHIGSSQLTCSANQLNDFNMMHKQTTKKDSRI